MFLIFGIYLSIDVLLEERRSKNLVSRVIVKKFYGCLMEVLFEFMFDFLINYSFFGFSCCNIVF